MKIIENIKAGVKLAPALLPLYFLFVSLDIYTTYLASPDLKYEGNWIVRNLNLNWNQFLILGSLNALLTSLLFVVSLAYVDKVFSKISGDKFSFTLELFQRKKLLLSIIVICLFYSHLIASAFLSLNNYLSYIYLEKLENFLTNISLWYINKVILNFDNIFTCYYIFIFTVAIVYVVFKVKKIRDKYRVISA